MKIAVLSGKGGTGKTTVSTNLAVLCGVPYIDCDVEEPNGFLFLNPRVTDSKEVFVEVPDIDKDKCSLCGDCAKVCQFHALAKVGKEILLFDTLCHSCGACELVCKKEALSFRKRSIGIVEQGAASGILCRRGLLNVGEPMAVPVIKHVLNQLPDGDCIIDCPPGTSCSVVNTLRYADAAILVTEPSEFGLHDLIMAVEAVRLYEIPFGVVINKMEGSKNVIDQYCNQHSIPILGRIPFSRHAAAAYSNGCMLSREEAYKKHLEQIIASMKEVFSWNW